MTSTEPAPAGQFRLLTQARFGALFWTQFLGAANDNLLKFALTVLVTYQLQLSWLPPTQAGLVVGAVFIAPFLLFSATAGQLADSRDMAALMRLTKNFEVVIALLAAWGFLAPSVPVLLVCVFGMGLHSTLFGPLKYAYLPRHLSPLELTGGNGMVEMGTFVAILLGNVAGGLLVTMPQVGAPLTAGTFVVLALLGRLAVQRVPSTPPVVTGLRVNLNPFSETRRNLRLAGTDPALFRSLLGVCWLWFLGALYVSLLPAFAKDVLGGDERVAALLLVVFSVGIGIGSLLCERLSRRRVEIGLVPVGAIGMTVFGIDLYFAAAAVVAPAAPGLAAFLAAPGATRVLLDLGLLALSAGLYSVPMYALIQLRSPAAHRARIFAAGNILSALFILAAAGFGAGLLALGLSIPQVFGLAGLLTAAAAGYIFWLVPEYLLRFAAFVLTRCSYRLRVLGAQHIPATGPAVVIANHVSFVDAIVLMAASPRPIRFVMDHRIFAIPVLGWLFRMSGAIPIAARRDDPEVYRRAFAAADAVLADGGLLGLFPEGAITADGRLAPFRDGIMKILAARPVPVVPVALRNLWGSYFSRVEHGRAMVRPFRRGLFSRVELVAGAPVPAAEVTPAGLRDQVAALLSDDAPAPPQRAHS